MVSGGWKKKSGGRIDPERSKNPVIFRNRAWLPQFVSTLYVTYVHTDTIHIMYIIPKAYITYDFVMHTVCITIYIERFMEIIFPKAFSTGWLVGLNPWDPGPSRAPQIGRRESTPARANGKQLGWLHLVDPNKSIAWEIQKWSIFWGNPGNPHFRKAPYVERS